MKFIASNLLEKPAMNFFLRIGSAAVLTLLVSAPAAFATTYDFTFTGNDGIDATGTIDVVGEVAQSGSISVINVPLEALPHTPLTTAAGDLLTPGGDVRNHDGDVITYDTFANPLNDPIFDNTGVVFVSGYYGMDGGTPEYNTLVNLWGNSPGSYGMFIGEANPADLEPDGTLIPGSDAQWVYVYDETGTLTLTPAPEPSTGALIILCALTVGFVAIRRRAAA